jgi:hypothetical protein
MKAAGSKPSKDSSFTPDETATPSTSRASAMKVGRYFGAARQSAIESLVSAVAKSSAP